MKRVLFLFSLVCLTTLFVACSEENDTVEEFPNWQENNDKYFNALYQRATEKTLGNPWTAIREWSLPTDYNAQSTDHIVVRVIEKGEGTVSPLYTDSVTVIYSGRLLPSTSYPTGFVFDQSFVDDFNPKTAAARGFRVSSNIVDGFATALQQMHCGDRWEVYIPANLGYGTAGNSSAGVPGHSVLIFDLMLKDIIK